MWRRKVQRVGNSLGVILPEEVLARLNLKNCESLQLTEAPDGSVLITPFELESEAQMRLARESKGKFHDAPIQLADYHSLDAPCRHPAVSRSFQSEIPGFETLLSGVPG